MSPTLPISGALALAVALIAGPASGDWLVLKDGSRIETDGGWREQGKMIVFNDASGRLMSLRASEVDLDESVRATHEAELAASQPPPPPPPPRPSVLSLTDADVAPFSDDEEVVDGDAEGEEAADETENDVTVADWRVEDGPDGEGQVVRGTVVNQGAGAVLALTARVTVFDASGVEIGNAEATLGSAGLGPSETTSLVAPFPELFDIEAVRFNLRHQSFDIPSGIEGLEDES